MQVWSVVHHHYHHHHKLLTPILLHQPFSVRLPDDVESRSRGTTATIHSRVMNAPTFGEPISAFIAITTTLAVPAPPAESNTTHSRPLSDNSTTATSRVLHTLQRHHTSHLHTRKRYLCASHTDMSGSGAVVTKVTERSMNKGKANAPISYAIFKDEEPTHVPCGSLRRM